VSTIAGDGRRLQQVLWNLVHNAVKFSKGGGRVEIHVQSDDRGLELTVKDNGQGISPAFLPHVFERFRQQDASSTRSAAGLGLGLSIAKHLVELHGGDISARSAGDGQGAAFTVTLPPGSAPGGDPERRSKEIAPGQKALA
jgi:signal transduction histidine kinase